MSGGRSINTEELTGKTFPCQLDRSLAEDIELMTEDGGRCYGEIPEGRENEVARKVLIRHLREGNSYGIWLKHRHTRFPQPELGPWLAKSAMVGGELDPLNRWQKPASY